MSRKLEFVADEFNSSDSLAASEAALLASNTDLDSDGKKQEHGRHQRFQDNANRVALGLLWAVAIFSLVGMIVYVWHLVAPTCWHWVKADELSTIRTLLTGVLFSSAMTGYVNKRMS